MMTFYTPLQVSPTRQEDVKPFLVSTLQPHTNRNAAFVTFTKNASSYFNGENKLVRPQRRTRHATQHTHHNLHDNYPTV